MFRPWVVYVMKPATAFVCSPNVTVLVGLVHNDGIALMADRASIEPFRIVTPGEPALGDDLVKLSASTEVIAGLAGIVAAPGVDLLAAVRRVVETSRDGSEAHVSLMRALSQAAPILREHHAYASQVSVFEQPVITVVLMGGRSLPGGKPQLVAYGIPDSGPPAFHSLQRSLVFAPSSVQLDAEAMILQDFSATPVADQAAIWGNRLQELAPLSIVRQRVDISPAWDHAILTSTGGTGVVGYDPPPFELEIPLH